MQGERVATACPVRGFRCSTLSLILLRAPLSEGLQTCPGMRTEGDSVRVVPDISGSCCYSCPGRETEARGEAVACIVACVGGKSPSWTPSLLPILLEAADENRGIGTERAWVLILPCFLLVWGKTLFLSEPLSLYLYNGGTSPAACPRLKQGPKRCNSPNSWG